MRFHCATGLVAWASEGGSKGAFAPMDFDIFLLHFQQKKILFLVSRGKIKFYHFSSPGKIFFATSGKKLLLTFPWKKSFRRPCTGGTANLRSWAPKREH